MIQYSEIRLVNRLDAEYFQRKFLQLQARVTDGKFRKLAELCEFIQTGPAGSALPASSYVQSIKGFNNAYCIARNPPNPPLAKGGSKKDSSFNKRGLKLIPPFIKGDKGGFWGGIKVYRPSNLNGWTCGSGGLVYVSKDFCMTRPIALYKPRDLLITRVGDIKFGIIEGGNTDRFAISPNMIALRTKEDLLDPYFLLAFLNTHYGFEQIKRVQRKVSLSSITKQDISNIQIPDISIKEQVKIGNLVRSGLAKKTEAKKIYDEADNLLLKRTCMYPNGIASSFLLAMTNSSSIRLSKLREARRADAEYFIRNGRDDKRNKIKTVQLGEIAYVVRGIEVGRKAYQENGVLFLRSSNISKFGLLQKSQKYISEDLYKKFYRKYQPQMGDILLVKDGKPGVSFLTRKSIEAVVSEGIVRLRLKASQRAEYISLCLNSAFCRQQIRTHIDGSLVPHLKIDQLRGLLIPIVSENKQKEISILVKKSGIIFQEGDDDLQSAKGFINNSF